MSTVLVAIGIGGSFLIGYAIGWRRCRVSLNRGLKTLSAAVSETGKASDSLADSISRNKQTKDRP